MRMYVSTYIAAVYKYVCKYIIISFLCMHLRMYINSSLFICVAITVRFNQSAYKFAKEDGMIQLFLVLSSPSSFNETVQLFSNIGTDNLSGNNM